jgi:hypothetical protein
MLYRALQHRQETSRVLNEPFCFQGFESRFWKFGSLLSVIIVDSVTKAGFASLYYILFQSKVFNGANNLRAFLMENFTNSGLDTWTFQND